MRLFGIGFIAFIVLVLFGKAYMSATRPAAPLPVSKTLDYFAPGVAIGAPVSSVKNSVRDLRFVSHLGFVGTTATRAEGAGLFSQVRLLLAPDWRVKPEKAAEKAPIDAVELVSAHEYVSTILLPEIATAFRTMPRIGCIRTSTPGRLREVQLWTTRNDMGGAAVINDWSGKANRARAEPVVVNLILYGGKFDGPRTLRADYVPISCATVAEAS